MPPDDPASPASICAALAARQQGLVTREQAFGAGMNRKAIERRLAAGAWIPVRRGVYRSASAPENWHQRALAACIGAGRASAVSHRSAAYLQGLLAQPPPTLEVVTRYGAALSGLASIARVHRVRSPLGASEVVRVAGVPATSIARTLVDLAGAVPAPQLAELVDRAMRSRKSDGARAQLVHQLDEARRGRSGTSRLDEVIGPWRRLDPTRRRAGLESVLEAQVLRQILAGGLPRPALQHPVELPGRIAYVDFAWPAARVALEVDGYAYHSKRSSFDDDRARGNELLVAGWQVLHTTATELRARPDRLIRTLTAALRLQGGGPAGSRTTAV